MERIYSLDYLRGLCAIGILVYHYFSWTYGVFNDANSVWSRIGLYGVSIFYILSGLTLYSVYFEKFQLNKISFTHFYKKRFLRIFPLLWLVLVLSLVLNKISPTYLDLFLQFSGLFGFFKWELGFSPGVWSIGNELVFYFIFPIFILMTKYVKLGMVFLSIIITSLFMYFTFSVLDLSLSKSDNWNFYINPLNQMFYFLSGFLIGWFSKRIDFSIWNRLILIIISLLLFIFYPVEGTSFSLVIGYNRIIFTLTCLIICFSIYKIDVNYSFFGSKVLALLGEISYSLYLLHPLVYKTCEILRGYFKMRGFHFSNSFFILFSVSITLIISYFSYRYFEKFFMKIGKSLK